MKSSHKARLPDGSRREDRCRLRATDEEWAAITAAAEEEGITAARWVREAALREATREPPPESER